MWNDWGGKGWYFRMVALGRGHGFVDINIFPLSLSLFRCFYFQHTHMITYAYFSHSFVCLHKEEELCILDLHRDLLPGVVVVAVVEAPDRIRIYFAY